MRNLMRELEENSRQKEILPYSKRRNEMLLKVCPSLRDKVLKALLGFRTILGNDLNDFQKVSLIYQMICTVGTYDYSLRKSLSYSFLGALKGLAVCAGYADLFVLLVGELTQSYIPYRVSGYIASDIKLVGEKDQGHAWVILQEKKGGRAWMFDPTWDLGRCTEYKYFCKTAKEIGPRVWAVKYLPACTEKFDKEMYTNKKKLALLVAYYKSMPQRFESGDFAIRQNSKEILPVLKNN